MRFLIFILVISCFTVGFCYVTDSNSDMHDKNLYIMIVTGILSVVCILSLFISVFEIILASLPVMSALYLSAGMVFQPMVEISGGAFFPFLLIIIGAGVIYFIGTSAGIRSADQWGESRVKFIFYHALGFLIVFVSLDRVFFFKPMYSARLALFHYLQQKMQSSRISFIRELFQFLWGEVNLDERIILTITLQDFIIINSLLICFAILLLVLHIRKKRMRDYE